MDPDSSSAPEVTTWPGSRKIENGLRSLICEVLLLPSDDAHIRRHLYSFILHTQEDLVAQVNPFKEGEYIVVPVRSLSEDPQVQVYFGWRADVYRSRRVHRVTRDSYCVLRAVIKRTTLDEID
jgi:hypothetical protein